MLLVFSCGGGSGARPSGHISTPIDHRPMTPAACPYAQPMPPCPYGGACAQDADCTSGPNGICVTRSSTCECQYNACVTDADCAPGTDCACDTGGGAGSGGGNFPTACVPANCRTDADCGVGGYCSPTFTGSTCGSLQGWFCHTQHDECGVDADCVSENPKLSYPRCQYSPERGISGLLDNDAMCRLIMRQPMDLLHEVRGRRLAVSVGVVVVCAPPYACGRPR